MFLDLNSASKKATIKLYLVKRENVSLTQMFVEECGITVFTLLTTMDCKFYSRNE